MFSNGASVTERQPINDVVLAMCSGALRRYLEGHDELPEHSLRALVPVSVREDGDFDSPVAVSYIVADLGTDLAERVDHGVSKQRPDVKVIFLSGHPADVLDAGAREGEHIEFIEKPPMDDTLLERIRDVLDRS